MTHNEKSFDDLQYMVDSLPKELRDIALKKVYDCFVVKKTKME
jgi:hypothetical protein